MPEIKNTFTQGKMNKDLDERIVPNGQYRDALNIQVSTSDGADIGTVQNILGNTDVDTGSYIFGAANGYECVGSIADEKNDAIYSFVTTNDGSGTTTYKSAIIEYKKKPDGTIDITPVLVDTNNSVLKFEHGNIITGINIIDNLLFWTDGTNEPKKINIDEFKLNRRDPDGTLVAVGNWDDHSKLFVDGTNTTVDVTEEHISVIKKKPLRPLSVKINNALTYDKDPLFEKIFPRFSYRYRYDDGEYSAFAPFTDVIFNSKYPTDDPTGALYDTNTAYDTREPYNSGMVNMIESIELYDFISSDMPEGVVQVDLLYKQENSSVVYVIEIIKNTDAQWTASGLNASSGYKGKFEVKSENIYAAVPESQLLRPWDNVPKTALAQEITGNRLVYGNYTQSYDLNVSPKVESDYKLRFEGQKHYEISYTYGAELLTNPDFTGDASGWTIGTYTVVTPPTPQSSVEYNNNAIELINVGSNTTGFQGIYQDNIGITAGNTYKVSFDISGLSGITLGSYPATGAPPSTPWIYGTMTCKLLAPDGEYIIIEDIDHDGHYELEAEIIDGSTPWTFSAATSIATAQSGGRLVFEIPGDNTEYTWVNCTIDNVSVQLKTTNTQISTFQLGGFPSVKSQRNYQLGVVYGDKYGRETPVFTSSDSSVVIPWNDAESATPIGGSDYPLASFSLQLETSLKSNHPTYVDSAGTTVNTFDYYKFFVKETSGEYYNLVMDALYNPTKADLQSEEHVWISFASSERNKISKDDYIILKKKFSNDPTEPAQIHTENKYRVLDVQNEAPDAIKYKYVKYGEILNDQTSYSSITSPVTGVLTAYGYLNANIFPVPDKRPIITGNNPEPIEIHIDKSSWFAKEGLPLAHPPTTAGVREEDLYFSFTKVATDNNQHSKKYKIASIRTTGTSASAGNFIIRLTEKITKNDSDTAENDTPNTPTGFAAGDLDADLTVRIEKKLTKDPESFSGRFFVKIAVNSLIRSELEKIDELEVAYNYHIEESANTFWHTDTVTSGAYDISAGLINNNGIGAVPSSNHVSSLTTLSAGVTNTEDAWDKLLTEMTVTNANKGKWFIDRMYMVASQTGDNAYVNPGDYAKFATQGWYGGNFNTVGDVFDEMSNVPSGYLTAGSISFPVTSIKPQSPGTGGANLINGLEGIIESGSDHVDTNGLRRWEEINWSYTNALTTRTQDDTYGDTTGKYFLHLSYLAPGSDLHNGNFTCGASSSNLSFGAGGTYPSAQNIMNQLQGIQGGGVFVWKCGDANNNNCIQQYSNYYVSQGSGAYYDYIPMEMGRSYGANDDRDLQLANCFRSQPPGYNPGVGHEWLQLHNNQWNLPQADSDFADQLYVGAKFRFSSDTNTPKIVYTIMGLKVKKVYNHTPWRTSWMSDGSGGLQGMGNSVEEAAITWANSCTNIATYGSVYTNQTNNGGDGSATDAQALIEKIQDFGRANNRRKVYILELDKNPTDAGTSPGYNPVDGAVIDSTTPAGIQMVTEDFELNSGEISQNPAIWETEPKDNVDLDIYYEASQAYPITLTEKNRELFAPIGCEVKISGIPTVATGTTTTGTPYEVDFSAENYLDSWTTTAGANIVSLNASVDSENDGGVNLNFHGLKITFYKNDGSYTTGKIQDENTLSQPYTTAGLRKEFEVIPDPTGKHGLSWYNCFSFGNGVESDRIRDDFNGMTITNGVRANATLDRPYEEEHRKSGLIYSGIYNSTSGINNLNQFVMAEKITKDLNPTYGSIQKLFSRRISLIAFCEDRVVGITANKNALYNADGNPQLVATSAVLGDANPFVGDYGISKNPESFAKDSYRAYFTDKQRGAVLRLSMDGLTPISDAGMSKWFKDEFKDPGYNFIGSFDTYKNDYNLTIDTGDTTWPGSKTITYSEDVKGWVSFKSFIQESGVSMSGDYYTFKNGLCYKHDNETRNTFYGAAEDSSITFLFNESPTVIKNFNTLNYDGDENWICESITTDQQSGTVASFIEKEGKFFNYIKGDASVTTLDTSAFNFQGIGVAKTIKYNI